MRLIDLLNESPKLSLDERKVIRSMVKSAPDKIKGALKELFDDIVGTGKVKVKSVRFTPSKDMLNGILDYSPKGIHGSITTNTSYGDKETITLKGQVTDDGQGGMIYELDLSPFGYTDFDSENSSDQYTF